MKKRNFDATALAYFTIWGEYAPWYPKYEHAPWNLKKMSLETNRVCVLYEHYDETLFIFEQTDIVKKVEFVEDGELTAEDVAKMLQPEEVLERINTYNPITAEDAANWIHEQILPETEDAVAESDGSTITSAILDQKRVERLIGPLKPTAAALAEAHASV